VRRMRPLAAETPSDLGLPMLHGRLIPGRCCAPIVGSHPVHAGSARGHPDPAPISTCSAESTIPAVLHESAFERPEINPEFRLTR